MQIILDTERALQPEKDHFSIPGVIHSGHTESLDAHLEKLSKKANEKGTHHQLKKSRSFSLLQGEGILPSRYLQVCPFRPGAEKHCRPSASR